MLVCNYAVIRFLPYVETGEFANFGVVVHCAETNYFGFQLLKKKVSRITSFFGELEPAIYRRALQSVEHELFRIQKMVAARGTSSSNKILIELTRPREAIVRFGELRVVMTADPTLELERLFDHHVRRTFVNSEYADHIAEKAVREILIHADLDKLFKRETFKAQGYRATFPFVRREEARAVKVIKPLNFAEAESKHIFDHGWSWVGRVKHLRSLHALPGEVLFPLKAPRAQKNDDYDRQVQFEAVKCELEDAGAKVLSVESVDAIAEWAAS